MSWEDCGFKPGKIHGPDKCPRQCSECDGEHHFYASSRDPDNPDPDDEPLPEGVDPIGYFACKHCGTIAELVDDDTEDADGDQPRRPEQRQCACPRSDAHECYRARYPGPVLFDEDEDEERRGERCECQCHAEIHEMEPEPWEVNP